jgi:hypothetical protein
MRKTFYHQLKPLDVWVRGALLASAGVWAAVLE